MKTAIVLGTDSLPGPAAEIDALMAPLAGQMDDIRLWLLASDPGLDVFPKFSFSLSKIQVIPVAGPCLPEVLLERLTQMASQDPRDLFFFPGTGMGPGLATRLAFRLGGSAGIQVKTLDLDGSKRVTLTKPAYGGNMEAVIKLASGPFCLAPEKGAFCPLPMEKPACPVQVHPPQPWWNPSWAREILRIPDEPRQGLETAERILVVGNGIGSRESMNTLERIASTLGAGLGASRPVVMNGWAPMDRLVGASGAVLSPRVCIAAGVSGTRVFYKGIEKSRLIVAVNTDPHAPIFERADIGIVDDLHKILPELERLITEGFKT